MPMPGHEWSLEDARSHLGAVIDAARTAPQTLIRRGKPAAIVLAVSEYERLRQGDRPSPPGFAEMLLAMPQDDDAFPRAPAQPRAADLA